MPYTDSVKFAYCMPHISQVLTDILLSNFQSCYHDCSCICQSTFSYTDGNEKS